jgi:hypothetical protein
VARDVLSAADMKAVLIGVVLLGALGCGGSSSTTSTSLLMNKEESFLGCFREGPFKVADGGSMAYDIIDSGNNMKVGVANYLDNCDLTNGYAITNNAAWSGEVMKSTGSLAGASYALVLMCNNTTPGIVCSPTVYSLTSTQ